MRDFSCCGLKLATLHDLLEHYEENHHQQIEDMNRQRSNEPPPDPKAAIASNAAAALKDPQRQSTSRADTPVQRTPTQPTAPTYPSQDEETVGNMEMDDDFSQMQYQNQMPNRMQVGPHRAPQLDMAAVNGQNALLQHQGLRNSTPTTPVSRNGYYHNNPTVSSVNTPTLTTNPTAHALQQQQFYTPDSSAPGTPAELEPEIINNLSTMNVSFMPSNNNAQPLPTNFDPNNWGYAPTDEALDFCIDEPAKRLMADSTFNPTTNLPTSQPSTSTLAMPTTTSSSGSGPNSASAQQLGDGQYGENSELARTIREQQKLAGVPDPSADGVPKPFHCPVIGCEKAYKNQNGLKYHKSVRLPLFPSFFSPLPSPPLPSPPLLSYPIPLKNTFADRGFCNSTATTRKPSTQTPTAPSPSSTRKPSAPIRAQRAWRSINRISARAAGRGIRISMG